MVVDDAFRWLRRPAAEVFDAIIVGTPDPDTPVLGRLYSTEFYGLVGSSWDRSVRLRLTWRSRRTSRC